MMNKKMMALLLAVSTISTSMFAILGRIVEGTFDTAERVATVPVDATRAAVDEDVTYGELREERRIDREYDEDHQGLRRRHRSSYDY